jgi:hypothetical protein
MAKQVKIMRMFKFIIQYGRECRAEFMVPAVALHPEDAFSPRKQQARTRGGWGPGGCTCTYVVAVGTEIGLCRRPYASQ